MTAALKNIRTLKRRSGMDVKLKIAPPTPKTLSTAALEDGIVKTLFAKEENSAHSFSYFNQKVPVLA